MIWGQTPLSSSPRLPMLRSKLPLLVEKSSRMRTEATLLLNSAKFVMNLRFATADEMASYFRVALYLDNVKLDVCSNPRGAPRLP